MERHIIEFAERLVGADNVRSALSLIDFPEEIRPAMAWIFGQIFICKDMETAKRIAFHEKIMKKCVTIEGDIFDPAGTLSGGAPSKTGSVLLKMEELRETRNLLKRKEQHLAEVERTLIIVQKGEREYASLKERFDLHKYEVDMVRQRLQQTTHHKIKEEVNSIYDRDFFRKYFPRFLFSSPQVELLKANIDNLMERMNAAKISKGDNEKRTKELECQLKDSTNIREKQLKESECLLASLKRKAEKSRAEWQKREQESETLELEIKELKGTIENGKEQLTKAEEKLIELDEIARGFEKELEGINATLEGLRNEIKEQKRVINQQNEDMQRSNARKEDIVKLNGEAELEIKKLNHEINRLNDYSKDCKEKVVELTKKYQWIEEDKQYFGKAGIVINIV